MPSESKLFHCLFWLTVIAVVIAQFALCHEALICRGWPPLSETGMYKMWASPFLIWLPAIFGTRVMRFRGLTILALSVSCLFAMISINGMMRPSIGHLAGVSGIIKHHYVEIIFSTLFYSPFVFAIMYFPERVFGDLWRAIWFRPISNMSFSETWKSAWALGVHNPH